MKPKTIQNIISTFKELNQYIYKEILINIFVFLLALIWFILFDIGIVWLGLQIENTPFFIFTIVLSAIMFMIGIAYSINAVCIFMTKQEIK